MKVVLSQDPPQYPHHDGPYEVVSATEGFFQCLPSGFRLPVDHHELKEEECRVSLGRVKPCSI